MAHLSAPGHRLLCQALIAVLLGASVCLAAEADNADPISIEANRMVSQENKNSVVFLGNVDARQGKLTIRSEEMTVFYTENTEEKKSTKGAPQPTNRVEKLICKTNVRVTEGDWLGTGERMDYFAPERKAVLSGNAKAFQGPNTVSGKTITYYLDEKRSVVEPDPASKGRVKAVIHPESKKTAN